MDRKGIETVLKDVFGPSIAMEEINGWVSIRCPLARWTHERGTDSRNSAGVSIQPRKTSVFNCYACKTKVPLQGLIKKYANYTGENFDDLIEELEDEAYLGPKELPDWEELRAPQAQALVPLDQAVYMDLYEPAAGHPYLLDRGIDDETADLLELKFDPNGPTDGAPRILFPVFGPERELYGFSGRDTSGEAALKVRDYAGLPKAQCLLGVHLVVEQRPDKVLVVEGLFDYANAWACGYPAVAVMHSTMTPPQAALLRDLGLPVYLFYDDDDAGKKGVQIAGEQLAHHVPVMRVRYPEIWIEDSQEEDGGHWVKDPGELQPEDFELMIADARLY